VKAWDFRHPALPFAVKGFEFRTPQPATRSATARTNPSFAATGRL
jgi:hypothetical protein